jgi:NAD(P)-dependent dehydrogenase (short-subunit alcohol dehydrogenase family)
MFNKVAIITGSESGIGKACAIALAKAGFRIGIPWYRSESDAKKVAETINVGYDQKRAIIKYMDLRNPVKAVEELEKFIEDFEGRIDVLVNNAGTPGVKGGVSEVKLEDLRETLEVNTIAPFMLAQCAASHMRNKGIQGRIINITSVHEHTPLPHSIPYTVSKHALGGLTKSLAIDLARYGITVNSVAPGMVATPMTNLDGADVEKINIDDFPVPRPGKPEEIANMVEWLCGEKSEYVTGQSLVVDGGFMVTNPQFKRNVNEVALQQK